MNHDHDHKSAPCCHCREHNVSKRDANTGRFVGKKLAGRTIDGIVYHESPKEEQI